MLFVLDVGNTNIVLGCIKNGNVLCKSRIKTDKNKTETEYAVVFKGFLDIYNIKTEDITGSIISSVVPPINSVLSEAVDIITGKEPEFVNVKNCTSLKIDMDNPAAMGSDLIVDAVAALSASFVSKTVKPSAEKQSTLSLSPMIPILYIACPHSA